MSEKEKDLVDFLYRLIEQGIHKIYDDDINDRKICEYINLIENQQEKIEKQAKEIENLKKQVKNKDLEAQRYFDTTIYQALQFDKEIQELKKDIDNNRKLFKELKEE